MARSVLLLLAGATTGAAAVWLLESSPSREGSSVAPTEAQQIPAPPPASAPAETSAAGGYAAERLAIFEQAADVTDPFEIEALIERTLDEPPSRLRELRLNALLQRYAELAPRNAVGFARTRYLDQAQIVPLFEIWAESDPDAAIAELALVNPPARRREIALAILDAIGNDADGIERVAEALPDVDRFSFEMDAMLLRAETDPARTLRDLLATPDYYRRTLMLSRVATVVALVDPRAALAQSASIEEYALRRQFRETVLSTWAAQDPEAVYAWLETAAIRDLPESTTVYQALARDDPNRLFAVLEGLPPAIQTNAKRAAMQVLAETDPNAAIAQLQTLPPGQERDNLLTTIGQAYGRQNPDLALAWVRTLPQAQAQNVMRSVIQGIMAVDPDRAVNFVIAELERAGQGPLATSPLSLASSLTSLAAVSSLTGNSQVDVGRLADRLLGINNPQISSVISSMVGSWARQSPDEALRWALANVDRLDRAAFGQMANAIAQADPEGALGMLNSVPPAQRPDWLSGVVQQIAQNDANRALELVGRYRGQPEYPAALSAVAQAVARTDPPRAAALLREAPPQGNLSQVSSTYLTIASQWSRTDPAAAADWALGISDPQAQRLALSQVTQAWTQRDPAAAESWLRDMSPGATRDQAATSLVTAVAQAGRFDPQMLDIFSSEQAAQNAAASAIRAVGRTNVQEARRLLDAHITDATLRRSVEDYLARSGGTGGAAVSSSGVVIF